ELVAEGPALAIHQPGHMLDGMDEWNTRQHRASGLVDRVRASRIDAVEAERATLVFLANHVEENASPMCGNSICQDRRFLAREMPQLEAFFHYRNLDVTTLKILAGLWAPDVLNGVKKNAEHLALADIRDSIEELRHYRRHLLGLDAPAA
ncbi:MAG: oligoribonuclease, partial [Gammaproteobacteria bacterium]